MLFRQADFERERARNPDSYAPLGEKLRIRVFASHRNDAVGLHKGVEAGTGAGADAGAGAGAGAGSIWFAGGHVWTNESLSARFPTYRGSATVWPQPLPPRNTPNTESIDEKDPAPGANPISVSDSAPPLRAGLDAARAFVVVLPRACPSARPSPLPSARSDAGDHHPALVRTPMGEAGRFSAGLTSAALSASCAGAMLSTTSIDSGSAAFVSSTPGQQTAPLFSALQIDAVAFPAAAPAVPATVESMEEMNDVEPELACEEGDST